VPEVPETEVAVHLKPGGAVARAAKVEAKVRAFKDLLARQLVREITAT
jgi:hypothetical protein